MPKWDPQLDIVCVRQKGDSGSVLLALARPFLSHPYILFETPYFEGQEEYELAVIDFGIIRRVSVSHVDIEEVIDTEFGMFWLHKAEGLTEAALNGSPLTVLPAELVKLNPTPIILTVRLLLPQQ